ncbi:hypothetical protein KAFR_0D02550 [Kazachstania africana CBS 2517]|uniref:protein-serine/threonine phosphatase n=1 Tax=Kazachstania africana (strain ATCC 22294 / BCRC 22015 / CBS 2517 / CECT 1963 / NBRC 1671 / NRRL Y-8276) TaxID=1071382 RepID=H2AU52_KAZAF|nr:hypothetical protein KAFR_0D02550 [Kazachstania africana CBS 2517]CCF57902.1 hypothetical protein KAFR_0D02550 [Kazachstania africana CBS 2517]
MGQLLSHPLTEKTIEYNDYKDHILGTNKLNKLNSRFYNCIGTMQGYRLTQEDSHIVQNEDDILEIDFYNPFKQKVEKLLISLFAVFDGHGGDECSKFLSGDYSENNNKVDSSNDDSTKYRGVSKWIKYSFENHEYGACNIHKVDSEFVVKKRQRDGRNDRIKVKRLFNTIEGLISQIIKDAFILQDKELYTHFANSSCGSTGVMALLINGEMLYVANCGDSRCILSSKNGGIKTMSFDHKPQHIGELLRINDNGGTVSLGRVGGVLALSRAFNDFQFKRGVQYSDKTVNSSNLDNQSRFRIPPQESQVTVEPDVLMHKIDYKKDEFLVIACDGIWDVYSNKQLLRFIKYHLSMGTKLDNILPKLLDHGIAQANSSTGVGFDNMTAIIVVLNKSGESLTDWYTKMKIRLEREKGLV